MRRAQARIRARNGWTPSQPPSRLSIGNGGSGVVGMMRRRILLSLKTEWPLCFNAATAIAFLAGGERLLDDLSHPVRFAFAFTWVVLVVLFSAFAVVRHAEHLARSLREPMGTL